MDSELLTGAAIGYILGMLVWLLILRRPFIYIVNLILDKVYGKS